MSDKLYKIAVIPGDGIGPEVMKSALDVLKCLNLPFEFEEFEVGEKQYLKVGTSIQDEDLRRLRAMDAVLFGAIETPSQPYPDYKSAILGLRRGLSLHANIRPIINRDKGIDIYIFRENTEGLYAQREKFDEAKQEATAEKVVTRVATEKIVRSAIDFFKNNGRRKKRGGNEEE